MNSKQLVKEWFDKWESGNFLNLPIAENFRHTSPYGTIEGRQNYINLVEVNKEKFLGHQFVLHDELYETQKACVRYTAIQGDFSLDVSEWYFIAEDQIQEIVAYYNIPGDISEGRKLNSPG